MINEIAATREAAETAQTSETARRVKRVMRSLARYTATQVSARAIAADMGKSDEPIKYQMVLGYIDALPGLRRRRSPAWEPGLRSRGRLREAHKRRLVDPSLAVAALGARPERLVREVDTLGLLFESLVVRDPRIYARAMDADVFHYHDARGLAADAVVQCRDGAWGARGHRGGPTSRRRTAAQWSAHPNQGA